MTGKDFFQRHQKPTSNGGAKAIHLGRNKSGNRRHLGQQLQPTWLNRRPRHQHRHAHSRPIGSLSLPTRRTIRRQGGGDENYETFRNQVRIIRIRMPGTGHNDG